MSGGKTCCGGACMTKSGCSLLTWKDPIISGRIFGALIGSLLFIKFFNIFTVFFYTSAVALAVSAIAEYTGKVATGTGFITRFRPATVECLGKSVDTYAAHIVTVLKKFETEFQNLIYSANISNTLKAAGYSYILYKLTTWFSIWTLVFTSVLVAFTVPPIYLKYQTEIDDAVVTYCKVAQDKAAEYQKIASEKATPYLKQAEIKLGPVGSFISSKLPVRTAGSTVGEEKAPLVPKTSATETPVEVEASKLDLPSVPKTKLDLDEQITEAVSTSSEPVIEKKAELESSL
ncbi:hypothetical protein B5S27_g5692 [[Candida] boidinii]|nr:hypothetical protein B5S27_g5692 [[Candida] boidinii]